MPFNPFSGSSGYWKYAIAGINTGGVANLTYPVFWDIYDSPLTGGDNIYSWSIEIKSQPVKTMTFDSECNDSGVVFPEVNYYGGVGEWSGQVSGFCSRDEQFNVGTPLICDFCSIRMLILEEETAKSW